MCKSVSILVVVFLLALVSCDGGGLKLTQSITAEEAVAEFDPSVFQLSDEEVAAIERGEDPEPTGAFGDLDAPVFSGEPPSGLNLSSGQLQGETAEVSKDASTYRSTRCSKHRKRDCGTCQPKVKCSRCEVTGICNISERFWAVEACDSKQIAKVTYAAQVYFNEGCTSKRGVEVVFKRDGIELGSSWTGDDGIAYFNESNVARSSFISTACVKSGGCEQKSGCVKTDDCTDHSRSASTWGQDDNDDDSCKPTVGATFNGAEVTVTSSKDLSNVVLQFCDGGVQKFEGLCGKSGKFKGTGGNVGKQLKGVWIKSGCNSSGDGPGYGEYVASNACTDCGCDEETDELSICEGCDFEGPVFCSNRVLAVHTTCIYGAVTGTGTLKACNPLRPGMNSAMSFRNWYENGKVQGYLNYVDGSIKIVNEAPEWMVVSGAHSWFGTSEWMVHVYDGGADFRQDFFEIFIWDRDYHCCGNLVGCYVNISFRYTNGLDTVAVKQN